MSRVGTCRRTFLVRTTSFTLALASVASCSGGDGDDVAVSATTGPPSASEITTTEAPRSEADSVASSTPPGTTTPEPDDQPIRCDPVAAGAVDGSEQITLRVWHSMNRDAESLLLLLADRFEAEHPSTAVVLEKVGGGYAAVIDRLSETPDDQLPDIIMASEQTVRLQADSGRFIPPADCAGGELPDQFADLLPVIRRTYTVDDVLQASPFNVSVPVMLFDRSRWERAGLDPDLPPQDFVELEQVIRQLKDSGEAATGAVLYDRSSLWLLEQPAAQRGELLVEPANGHAGLDVERVVFNRPAAVEVLTTFQALKQDGYIFWSSLNSANEDLTQLVHPTTPSGLTFNSSAVIGDIIRLVEGGGTPAVDIGVAPFPGPGDGSTIGGGAWWLLDHADPVRAGAGWTLIDWLTQPELIAEVSAFTGYVPTTQRAADQTIVQERWAEWPILRVGYDQALASADTEAAAGLQVGPQVEVDRNLELAAAFAIDAGSDPATELANAEERSLEVIDLYAESFSDTDG